MGDVSFGGMSFGGAVSVTKNKCGRFLAEAATSVHKSCASYLLLPAFGTLPTSITLSVANLVCRSSKVAEPSLSAA